MLGSMQASAAWYLPSGMFATIPGIETGFPFQGRIFIMRRAFR